MDIFSTYVLNRVVNYLDQPASFLLDTFFTDVQTDEREEIYFDIEQSKPRLAVFVSPLIAGRVTDEPGYSTRSFRPAYVKDKKHFNASIPLKRRIGERIGGELSGESRLKAAVNEAIRRQLENLTRREELMAAQALIDGKVIVREESREEVVDFGRDPALKITLTGNSKWTDPSVPALDQLEDWAALIQNKSGAVAKDVVMDPKAWRLLRKNKQVLEQLDIRRGTTTTLNTDPIVRGQGQAKARYVGTIGDLNLYIYNDVYIDETQKLKHFLPDNTVLLVSRDQLEGTRCYGMIQDEEANFRATRYFSKSWLEKDPAVRWLLLQSAPLVVPFCPNASLCATVA